LGVKNSQRNDDKAEACCRSLYRDAIKIEKLTSKKLK
jgi:hypothetical protein